MEWLLFVLIAFDARGQTHLIDGFSSKEKCMTAGDMISKEIRGAWLSNDSHYGTNIAGQKQSITISCKPLEK